MTPTERKTWLAKRQQVLGATDIASIAGVGFQTAQEVYAEKIAPEPIDREPNALMQLGLATERMNAAIFASKIDGLEIAKPLDHIRSPKVPFLGATLDFITDDMEPVDTKYVGPFFGDRWGEELTDEVPDGYVLQLTWQILAVRDHFAAPAVNRGHVSALAGSGDHRRYILPFDARLAGMLLDLGAAFWKFVEARQEPLDWQHPLQAEITNRLAELRPDVSIELDEAALSRVICYQEAKEREKAAKKEADELKAELLKALAGAGEGRLPDGQRITQKIVNRKAYTVESCSYLDFRIKSSPKKVKV